MSAGQDTLTSRSWVSADRDSQTQMHVSHYLELENHVTGGISESVRHQRKVLERLDHTYSTEPTLEADVLHVNLMGPRSVWYAKRASARDIPVVAHTHITAEDFGDSFRFTNTLAKPLKPYLRWAYSHADRLVCPSEYNRNIIENYTTVPTRVISNGVDLAKLEGVESLESEAREQFDLSEPVVFLVGHVIKRKGLETFVELARRLPEFDFAWFGPIDPSLKGRETKQLIRGAPDNCTFTGFVEDIRMAYAAGDIFLFPTHEENEGIALLEAMAASKAVVVRDIETFTWLEDGADCLKVSDGLEAFETALERLRDQDLRERLGNNAAARSEDYSLSAIADQYNELYDEVVRMKNPEVA